MSPKDTKKKFLSDSWPTRLASTIFSGIAHRCRGITSACCCAGPQVDTPPLLPVAYVSCASNLCPSDDHVYNTKFCCYKNNCCGFACTFPGPNWDYLPIAHPGGSGNQQAAAFEEEHPSHQWYIPLLPRRQTAQAICFSCFCPCVL